MWASRRILYAENLVYAPSVQKANRLLASAKTSILHMVGEESHSGTRFPLRHAVDHQRPRTAFRQGCLKRIVDLRNLLRSAHSGTGVRVDFLEAGCRALHHRRRPARDDELRYAPPEPLAAPRP